MVSYVLFISLDITVGFTREFTRVSEGVGSFELCVTLFIPELNSLRGPFQLANPIMLELMSVNGTAGEWVGEKPRFSMQVSSSLYAWGVQIFHT